MKIFKSDTYEEMSRQASKDVFKLMKPGNLICTASGDSPAGLYKQIVADAANNNPDVSQWYFVGLDEWVGLNGNDEGSCRFILNNQLFIPLKVPEKKICFFDGKARDLDRECEQVESFIHQHKGINVAIVGIGMNGHVGMNEPGISSMLHSHVIALHNTTQQVGKKYFKKQQPPGYGITLGIANLMEANHIFLLVSGLHKAEIVKHMLEGEITEQLPASLLRNHSNLHIYLDADAASMLQPIEKYAN